MTRHMIRTIEKTATIIISLFLWFFALLSIPALQDLDTCFQAAFVITIAYAWFVMLVWANFIHGRR